MKLLKSLLVLALALTIAISMTACGGDENQPTDPAGTTTAPTLPTTEPTVPTEDDKVVYTVTVVDEAGNPVEGVVVQLCLDLCTPSATDAAGVATYRMDAEADYKVSFPFAPEGYLVEEAYHFAEGSHDLTITLQAA